MSKSSSGFSGMTRRQWVKVVPLAAVAGLTACTRQEEAIDKAKEADTGKFPNVFDALGHYEFIAQGEKGILGAPVNIKALRNRLKNDYLTLTFGYKECGLFCPRIDKCLEKIGEMHPGGLTSIVVSIAPESDGKDESSRRDYMSKLKTGKINGLKVQDSRLPQNTIILYPSRNGQPSNEEAGKMGDVVKGYGAIKPLLHTTQIFLFAPEGKYLDQKTGMGNPDTFRDWQEQIAQTRRP